MDEFLVYLEEPGCYGLAVAVPNAISAEYYVDGDKYLNTFLAGEYTFIRFLEEE